MRILIIEDEEIQRISLTDDLTEKGHEVCAHGDPRPALDELATFHPDVVLTDLKLPGFDGLEVVRRVRHADPDVTVLVMTAFGSVETAVEAMRLGAVDYLTKPFRLEELCLRLERIERERDLNDQNIQLRRELSPAARRPRFLGDSPATDELRRHLGIAATGDGTILLTGETGTGKDLAAAVIHAGSDRREGPLVKVSCASLSPEVIESELFGHEKGAFTGAGGRKPGRFELASGGTLYLDEVDDIPLSLQVKLLRVIEERVVERVGGTRPVPVDVRIIAATKVDLEEMVNAGRFRRDLYYRLNIYPVHLPPLRERREDVGPLFRHFLARYFTDHIPAIAPETLRALERYDWPGNVRQLRNEVERLAMGCCCEPVTPDCLSPQISGTVPPEDLRPPAADTAAGLREAVARLEQDMIREALRRAGGNQTAAAAALGLPVTTLKSKIKRYGLHRGDD